MSRFYVGQRVRIKYAERSKHLIGAEATVVRLDSLGYGRGRHYLGIETDLLSADGIPFIAWPDWLEPATDSYDVTTWDTCVWKPEHLRVEA